jgi:hypothetical protein
MGALEIAGLVAKIAMEAPVLMPDLLNVLKLQMQAIAAFNKLVADFQQSQAATTAKPAA